MPPLPKKKHSRSRRGGRAAHHRARRPTVILCKDCGAAQLPHRMCADCGRYNGRQVVAREVDAE